MLNSFTILYHAVSYRIDTLQGIWHNCLTVCCQFLFVEYWICSSYMYEIQQQWYWQWETANTYIRISRNGI